MLYLLYDIKVQEMEKFENTSSFESLTSDDSSSSSDEEEDGEYDRDYADILTDILSILFLTKNREAAKKKKVQKAHSIITKTKDKETSVRPKEQARNVLEFEEIPDSFKGIDFFN